MVTDVHILRYGSPDPLPEAVPLRAGPISCVFMAGELRDIALAGQIVLRRIYVAVRDAHWGTVPLILRDVELVHREGEFEIAFWAEHHQGEVHFAWRGAFYGGLEGTLDLVMEGRALAAFSANRIGFCVLYPETCAGAPCTVEHTDGSVEEGHFPQAISPHQPFFAIRAISHTAWPGVRLRVDLEGDTFEMEDQRNWSDASFKVYSRPLALPYPFAVAHDGRIAQAVRVKVSGCAPRILAKDEPTLLEILPQSVGRLPALGFGIPHRPPPAGPARERLRALRPAHLRLDLDPTLDGWPRDAEQAAAWAQALGAPLEIALFLPDEWGSALEGCARALRGCGAPICRWLLYRQGQPATPPGLISLARTVLAPLAPGAKFAVGTPMHFTELNRARPSLEGAEAVAWSLTPQVHAFDNASLIETLAIQAQIAENARALYPQARRVISPITLKPRPPLADRRREGATPALGVDVRQPSLFAAAWTLGSIASLAGAGASSLTYYEALGRRGLMEEERVFPVYHALAWLAPWRGAEVLRTTSSAPLKAVALALEKEGQRAAFLANLTPQPQPALLRPARKEVRLVRLNEVNAEAAMACPEGDWPLRSTLTPTVGGALAILLWPYEVAWVDGLL